MQLTIDGTNRISERGALRAMFAARKRVFVDLLKWDIPVLDQRFEIDQFDEEHARYIVLLDRDSAHLASARLLPTTRPGILDSLYPYLADEPLPVGDDVFEITRFCLTPDRRASERRIIRDNLVVALVQQALDTGITTYTGVADLAWLRQILAFGWSCRTLGAPRMVESATLGALRIDIDGDTLGRLAANGIVARAPEPYPASQAA